MELERKRSRLKCFVSIIDLRFASRVPFIFGLFVLLFGPHFPMSYFLNDLMILFHVGSCAFEISTKLVIIVVQ